MKPGHFDDESETAEGQGAPRVNSHGNIREKVVHDCAECLVNHGLPRHVRNALFIEK